MHDGWRRGQYYHHPFVSEKPIGARLVCFSLSTAGRYADHWMEIIYGAAGKAGQAKCKTILDQFAMEYLTRADMDWAMQQLERYRLSQGVGINDCLIASVCHRLHIPIYTHNLRDMRVLLDESLVIKPY